MTDVIRTLGNTCVWSVSSETDMENGQAHYGRENIETLFGRFIKYRIVQDRRIVG